MSHKISTSNFSSQSTWNQSLRPSKQNKLPGPKRDEILLREQRIFRAAKHALLQAHYSAIERVYRPDFPMSPEVGLVTTGTPPNNTMVSNGTKVVVLPFNSSVEVILQDTSILGAESHPLHLHGFNFFVVGQGFETLIPNRTLGISILLIPLRGTLCAIWGLGCYQILNRRTIQGYGLCIATLRFTRAGFEDGLVGFGWKASKSKAAPPTKRSSKC
ncbi:hypothetical protein DH2020_046036 [Rehmannia glutinosa]|uniref:Plastocyanin-like domain-containing protein n=1 Tax=Rehmannia glutinosa TaxID=99300 RepID=A0ABR0UDR1_REHGL